MNETTGKRRNKQASKLARVSNTNTLRNASANIRLEPTKKKQDITDGKKTKPPQARAGCLQYSFTALKKRRQLSLSQLNLLLTLLPPSRSAPSL